MSSVEASQREQDSLSQQQQEVLKNKKIQRNRHHSRGSRSIDSQEVLYNQTLTQYMFGKFQIASQNCKKMIANNSQNPQPYFLMATMHQQAATRKKDENQLYKSVQYFFFHAFYSPPSVQKWLKVADMSYELQLFQQAAYCYGRALKMNKTNLQLSLKRAECLQKCLQIKKAANIYKRIIQKISNSATVYKSYAKLRFKRQQYSKARQILLSFPNFQQDLNIKFMIAETLLKQMKFLDLFSFICKYIIELADPPVNNIYEDLPIQIIQMLFICRINYPNQTSMSLQINQTLQFLQKQYSQQQHAALYSQIILYIKKVNPQITYKLLKFLLKFQHHQSIEYYLYCSEYLMKNNKNQQAIKILSQGLNTSKNRNSVQLKTQLNYLKTLSKNKKSNSNYNYNKSSNHLKTKQNKNKAKVKQNEQEIFYSDEEQVKVKNHKKQSRYQEQSQIVAENEKQQKQHEEDSSYKKQQDEQQQSDELYEQSDEKKQNKTKKISKKNNKKGYQRQTSHMQIKDPDIVSKLISNNQLTLTTLKVQIQLTNKENDSIKQAVIYRTFPQVKQCLQYLVQIQSTRQQSQQQILHNAKNRHSIFNNRQPKKRRMIMGSQSRRNNLITRNSGNLLQSLRSIIFFMKEYIKIKRFNQVVDFAQMLSKAHFFKWQNRIMQFKILKHQVYQMGVLACLELKKYGKSIFFLRYLINKNPLNQFYLAIAQKIMRLSTGKLFINKMIKKGIQIQPIPSSQNQHKNQKQLIKIYYMTGLQYMQNCFFQLAINMFTKVLHIIEMDEQQQNNRPSQQIKQMCKTMYLCMSTCFLQMSSSRTVYNKLDQVNRSAYCLARYKLYCQPIQNIQVVYNQARWYSFVKLYSRAIPLYYKILQHQSQQQHMNNNKMQQKQQKQCNSKQLKSRSLINLMIIYKDMEEYDKIKQLGQKYLHNC